MQSLDHFCEISNRTLDKVLRKLFLVLQATSSAKMCSLMVVFLHLGDTDKTEVMPEHIQGASDGTGSNRELHWISLLVHGDQLDWRKETFIEKHFAS